MKTIKIYNAQDRIEAERVLSELKKEGIECYTMDADVGEYMRIVEGFSVFGCVCRASLPPSLFPLSFFIYTSDFVLIIAAVLRTVG